jgi:hypothetical protein
MRIEIVKYIDVSEIEIIPKIGLRISQPDFVDMEWKCTYRNVLLSFRFIIFAFGIKLIIE